VGVIGLAPEAVWRRRARHIREFERMLVAEGTAIVKVFLSVSKDEQAERTSVCPRGGGRGYRA
jgi:polyphosphate kinase 2 (PPK2 family)